MSRRPVLGGLRDRCHFESNYALSYCTKRTERLESIDNVISFFSRLYSVKTVNSIMYSRIDFTLPIQRSCMVEHGVPFNENYLHIDSSGHKVGGKMPLSSSSATLVHFDSLFSTPSFLPFPLPPSVNINRRKIKQGKEILAIDQLNAQILVLE